MSEWSDKNSFISFLKQQIAFLFGAKSQTNHSIIGLDINSDPLKLLKINRTDSSCLIEELSILPLSDNQITDNKITDNGQIAATIKKMFEQANIKTKEVAIAIPRSIAIMKNITIDARLTDEEIESRAWIEAQHHFPDLVGDIFMDFYINGISTKNSSQLDLTLVACRKSQINPYLDILKEAGLVAKIVDIDCYALERALPLVSTPGAESENIAMFNLNKNTSMLIVVRNGKLVYAHDQGYDGKRLLAQTTHYLENKQIDPEDLSNDPAYQEILKNCLGSHLRHALHFMYTSQSDIVLKKIILVGDCAPIAGLASFIERETGIECGLGDLSSHVTLAPHINKNDFDAHALGLVLCCGLALSHVESS